MLQMWYEHRDDDAARAVWMYAQHRSLFYLPMYETIWYYGEPRMDVFFWE